MLFNRRAPRPVWPTLAATRSGGFTILELVVVLAVAVLMMSTLPFAFGKLFETAEYRGTVREIMAGLKDARSNALSLGHPVAFMVNANTGVFGMEGRELNAAPSGIKLSLVLAEDNVVDSGIGRFVFFPEGGSTGGSIEVLRGDNEGIRLRVDWLLGRVSQEALLQ